MEKWRPTLDMRSAEPRPSPNRAAETKPASLIIEELVCSSPSAIRAAMHRVHRQTAVSGGLQKVRSYRFPVSVSVRSPPCEARASPRPRSRANQDVTLCVDQDLRRHTWAAQLQL